MPSTDDRSSWRQNQNNCATSWYHSWWWQLSFFHLERTSETDDCRRPANWWTQHAYVHERHRGWLPVPCCWCALADGDTALNHAWWNTGSTVHSHHATSVCDEQWFIERRKQVTADPIIELWFRGITKCERREQVMLPAHANNKFLNIKYFFLSNSYAVTLLRPSCAIPLLLRFPYLCSIDNLMRISVCILHAISIRCSNSVKYSKFKWLPFLHYTVRSAISSARSFIIHYSNRM